MKRSLRLPFSLLSEVVVLTLLAAQYRAGSPLQRDTPPDGGGGSRGGGPPEGSHRPHRRKPPLRRPAARRLRDPLAGRGRPRPLPPGELPARARLRPHKDYSRILPEFRRTLSDWFRSRRFQPTVMQELLAQVKGAIDHDGGAAAYRTCAVVGNSGILLRRDDGDLIDGHEMVIRLNNARISGYKRHTGSKTSISFVNSNILR